MNVPEYRGKSAYHRNTEKQKKRCNDGTLKLHTEATSLDKGKAFLDSRYFLN